jgi:hypothetical protein
MLREAGDDGFEAVVVWAGQWRQFQQGLFSVELMMMPRQQAVRTEHGVGVLVDDEAMFEMNRMLNERNLRLAAQVHSHPTDAYHSETDERYSIVTARGGLSLVVPDFARDPFSLGSCAVYRLEARNQWVEVPESVIGSLICIDEES